MGLLDSCSPIHFERFLLDFTSEGLSDLSLSLCRTGSLSCLNGLDLLAISSELPWGLLTCGFWCWSTCTTVILF